jgi:PII-like signaling protein
MKTIDIVVVKVYITESSHLLNKIVRYLKNEAKIRGVSVFRAISGFGETGDHTASLIDLSLDLPLVIEFFDSKNRIEPALDYLNGIIKHEHIVFWDAKAND